MKTILILTACYDEPHRTMGSVPKIARQLAKRSRVVVFSGGHSTRVEDRSPNLRIYFFKEWLIKDPVNYGIIFRQMYKLDTVMRKECPDMILNVKYMFYPNLLSMYLNLRGYAIVTATDAFPGYTWFSASSLVNFVMRLYTRTLGLWVLRSSKRVLLFHEGLVEQAKQLDLPWRVVHNGVEMELIAQAKKKKLAGKINIIYVGRLESVKGYDTIFAAMKRIVEKHKDVHFYHLGNNKGKEEFLSSFAHKQIHSLGQLPIVEVYSYLQGADIVVLASKSEGLPNALMEGMACGCVPVTTAVGAIPYVVEDGKLAKFFEYGDVDGLVKQTEWLISHPKEREALAKKCRTKIQQEYNWETLADQYYEELCAALSALRGRTNTSSKKD